MEIKTSVAFRSPKKRDCARSILAVVLGVVVAFGVMCSAPPPAGAVGVDIGPVKGRLDTTVTFGISLRVQDHDPAIISVDNGGTAFSSNYDDGNLNFDQGDITSLNLKILHEAQFDWKNYSFFGRFYYFYDWAIMKLDPERTGFTEQAQRRAGMDIRLLDAYLAADYELFGKPITIRIGNQVLSWGESTFIQSGINSINPVDVTALRSAGSEIKEALIPVPMISLNAGITDNFSIEAFYQFYWDNTEIEPIGTFFSTTDVASPGADKVVLGFGMAPDNPALPVGSNPPIGSWLPRGPDNEARDMGQGGVALRYFATWLQDAEFGLYWEHLHSRRSLISGVTGDAPPTDPLELINWGLSNGDYASTGYYFRDFPEDIDLVGGSLSMEIGTTGIAFQGEACARLDQPIQVDDTEVLFAAFSVADEALAKLKTLENALEGDPTVVEPPIFGNGQLVQRYGYPGPNQVIRGYERKDMVQAQFTVTKIFGPTLGTDQITVMGEFGATWFPGLEDKSEFRYDGPGTSTSGNPWFTAAGVQPRTQKGGWPTKFSCGYRLVMLADFNNAIGPVTLQPMVAWYHDVDGTTPAPISNFLEDRKTVTVALRATYLNTLKASLSYTNYFGAGAYNILNDRDYVSLSVSLYF